MPGYQTGAYPQSSFPATGPQQQQQPPPSNFPAYSPAPKEPEAKSKKKWLIPLVIALVVLLGGGATYYFTTSTTTYSAAECKTPGQADDKGFTGCLRQLAGKVADTGDCEAGMGNGPTASAEKFGASSTCAAPGRAGTQVTYLQSDSAGTLKTYTDELLKSADGDIVTADWKGNGLDGSYSSAAGANVAVLVFTVKDRPLTGFLYQVNSSGQTSATAGTLATYFE